MSRAAEHERLTSQRVSYLSSSFGSRLLFMSLVSNRRPTGGQIRRGRSGVWSDEAGCGQMKRGVFRWNRVWSGEAGCGQIKRGVVRWG